MGMTIARISLKRQVVSAFPFQEAPHLSTPTLLATSMPSHRSKTLQECQAYHPMSLPMMP